MSAVLSKIAVPARMRATMLRRSLREHPGPAVAGLTGLLAAGWLIRYARHGDQHTLGLLAGAWVLGWIVLPLLLGGGRGRVRPAHLRLEPIGGVPAAIGLLAASAVGVGPVVSLVALAALPVHAARYGPGAVVVTASGAVLLWLIGLIGSAIALEVVGHAGGPAGALLTGIFTGTAMGVAGSLWAVFPWVSFLLVAAPAEVVRAMAYVPSGWPLAAATDRGAVRIAALTGIVLLCAAAYTLLVRTVLTTGVPFRPRRTTVIRRRGSGPAAAYPGTTATPIPHPAGGMPPETTATHLAPGSIPPHSHTTNHEPAGPHDTGFPGDTATVPHSPTTNHEPASPHDTGFPGDTAAVPRPRQAGNEPVTPHDTTAIPALTDTTSADTINPAPLAHEDNNEATTPPTTAIPFPHRAGDHLESSRGAAAGPPVGGESARRGWLGWVPAATRAVAGRELRSWVRHPLRLQYLAFAVVYGALLAGLPLLSDVDLLLPWAGPFAVLGAAAMSAGLVGLDGTALWLPFTTPGGERAEVRGRALAWLVLMAPIGLLLTVAGAVLAPGVDSLTAFATLPALLGAGASVPVWVSLLRVRPVADPRHPTSADNPTDIISVLVATGGGLLAAAPVIALAIWGPPALMVPFGLLSGAALWWGGIWLADDRLAQRGTEVLASAGQRSRPPETAIPLTWDPEWYRENKATAWALVLLTVGWIPAIPQGLMVLAFGIDGGWIIASHLDGSARTAVAGGMVALGGAMLLAGLVLWGRRPQPVVS